ncbi:MAG: class I tRNA ligase family protein, partial [Ilumatobacteraceae bacterium]
HTVPWRHAALSGWILDPDRKKMSKSKGNTVTPMHLLEQYGTDAVRYWSASGRPGVDTAFDEGQMKIGRKLALKILNVSKFVLGFGEPEAGATAAAPLDLAMLDRLDAVIADATTAFEGFDYARALERAEGFFWWFCDDYVELVKTRAYRDDAGAQSARAALRDALSTVVRLFAPFLPFVTDEVWQWWQPGSVHASSWPEPATRTTTGAPDPMLDALSDVLGAVRRAKTEAKLSQRAAVESLTVRAPIELHASITSALDDLREAGSVAALELVDSGDGSISCDVQLAPLAPA